MGTCVSVMGHVECREGTRCGTLENQSNPTPDAVGVLFNRGLPWGYQSCKPTQSKFVNQQ